MQAEEPEIALAEHCLPLGQAGTEEQTPLTMLWP